ncbi:adenosylcobinamide kinase/adenosylcobinamide phosphate guanyltransferase [Paenibacillus faecis]|uniref:bifunctional adenosylcobinamide kinase/adenosylcobinamide-phosphate guanylyltransferase n=1 Tax=Paenibacillus faecis TaxID=862114 RepID=UPI001B1EB10B|nr:bifunctional adenosylcobinamide kinase/adenosylcobinamide-phosphate guanylyltransferase [Paenibacillus faecis]GIO84383.1 adenosylcobinamide kinase/adenosylcobinamide phosphate guanyltransferase [Paenibacillus faecis]
MIVTVTGGARSGKSSFAERWCMKHAPSGWYVATAQAFDEEMRLRIDRHRLQREGSRYPWTTLEEPLRLAGLLRELPGYDGFHPDSCVLVDCLTLWLSNVLLAEEAEGRAAEDALTREIARLQEAVASYPGTLVLVTNEVGSGIVPEYPLGRLYRDYAGILNQRIAAISDQVFLVTAGIPIELKSREYLL